MFDFLELDPSLEPIVNLVFLIATGIVAWRGLHARNEDGKADFVHLLFGCIAGLFFFAVLFQDVLGLVQF